MLSLGYLTRGLTGSVLALIAVTIPPMLVLVVRWLYRRYNDRAEVRGFMRGLALSVSSVMIIVLFILLKSFGFTYVNVGLAVCAAALTVWSRVPTPVILALAGMVGMVLLR